jgi:stage III sporulation protein AA
MKKIIEFFPDKLKNILYEQIKEKQENLEEIRIRIQNPIILKFDQEERTIKYIPTSEDMLTIMELICENSIYSYQKQISAGFITLQGGHRVGIVGSCVIENNKVINIKYINSFNFRIARQVIGAGNQVLQYILKDNKVLNTLIVSPPGYGKTTILRDVARLLSTGNRNWSGVDVGIIDERSEIASLYKGIPQNEVGIRTDIIENISKSEGMKILVRSMSPKVIIADEIGIEEDVYAINYALCSGCKGIFTAHGSNFEDISLNPVLKTLLNKYCFDCLIFLDKKKIKEVYYLNEEKNYCLSE